MVNRSILASYACVFSLAVASGVSAQQKWTWPGCTDVSSADFTKVVLVNKANDPSLTEPTRMDFAPDGRIFYSERTGKLKIFKPSAPGASTGTIVTAATMDVYSGTYKDGSQSESGIQGMVLDPGFATNNYIYLDYSPKADSQWNVSRFTMTGDVLDKASEKILFSVHVQRVHCCHTGGGMEFDAKGDLWMSLGNNTANPVDNADQNSFINENAQGGIGDDQGHAANTNDLRGKIIRIHPTPDGKYTIPAGNLFPAGTAKTRGEIYTMGHRNAYTIALDKYRGWLAWGDVGPDQQGQTEEHNLVTKPGFMGWPYFVGGLNSHTTSDGASPVYSYRGNKNPAAPMNTSINNTGIQNLPPANPAILPYNESAAMTGPIFHYDGANPSKIKLPPHFNEKWFISDWNNGQGYMKVVSLNADGSAVTDNRVLFANNSMVGPITIKVGPDGALYVLEYGGAYFATTGDTKIARYEYKGTCLPATPTLPSTGIGDVAAKSVHGLITSMNIGLNREVTVPASAKAFSVFNLQGKVVWEYRVGSQAETRVTLPSALSEGLYRVKFEF
ncbi:MAG: domain containing protein [Fibrobacteres bacterium]|nr:domain containing protein [Fibrobacterota bacterium]